MSETTSLVIYGSLEILIRYLLGVGCFDQACYFKHFLNIAPN
uniref:Uncharacterized protein n=1 Tax=Arundo donax TaxID=35708 RepID=A0A0A9ALE8_ARUDO